MNLLSKSKSLLTITAVLLSTIGFVSESYGQNQEEEIQKLKEQLNLTRAVADSAILNAEHLRFRRIANSMAIKSTYQRDPQTQGLVALQAYKFHKEHREPHILRNDNIYTGIYQAIRKLYGDSINTYVGHTKAINSVVNDDGGIVYSAGEDGRVLAWDLTNPTRQYREIYKAKNGINEMALSNDNQFLAGAVESKIVLIDLNDSKAKNINLKLNNGIITNLAFLPDNDIILSVNETIWRTDFSGEMSIVGNMRDQVTSLSVNLAGSILAAGDNSGAVEMWDLLNDNKQRNLFVNSRPQSVDAVTFSQDGNYVAYGFEEGELAIYDLKLRQMFYEEASAHAMRITDISFGPEGKLLATSSEDGTAKIWVLDNIFDFPVVLGDHYNQPVRSVQFLNDGTHVITGEDDGVLKLWPTKPDDWANTICNYLSRNMNRNEWWRFVGMAIPYPRNQEELTCPQFPGLGKY